MESCRCALWGCKAYTVRGEVEGCFQGMCALCFGLQNWWLGGGWYKPGLVVRGPSVERDGDYFASFDCREMSCDAS